MASEQLTVRSSAHPIVGFVGGEQSGQLLVLDRERLPVWVKTSAIQKREVCVLSAVPDQYRWLTTPINSLNRSEIDDCADDL